MALSPILLLVPAVLLLAGGRKKKRYPAWLDESQREAWDDYGIGWDTQDDKITGTEGGLPLSDRMLLNADCSGPAAKTIKWRYDLRITNYYWEMRREWKIDDPLVLAAEILYLDSPECAWPADPEYSTEWEQIIWDGTYQAVKTYFELEQSGELWEKYAIDPNEPASYAYVKPVVPW